MLKMHTDTLNIDFDKYETVIGLEVHAQMLTHSKAYCSDEYQYGAEPNTKNKSYKSWSPRHLAKTQ
jgi:Asp-tRNA(Asn)/Glu-tRNA(Gln) amidotransferase B subunit